MPRLACLLLLASGARCTGPIWDIVSGACTICGTEDECVCSPNYPSSYDDTDCVLEALQPAPLTVDHWDVPSGDSSNLYASLNAQSGTQYYPNDYVRVVTDNYVYAFDGRTAGPIGYSPTNGNDIKWVTSDQGAVAVSAGDYPSEVLWSLLCDGVVAGTGGAPYSGSVSVGSSIACTLSMRDSYGDGWNGAQWVGLGKTITLESGSSGSQAFTTPGPTPPTGFQMCMPQAPIVPCEAPLEIVLVMDRSGSMGDFVQSVIFAALSMLDHFALGPTKTRAHA